MSKFVINVTEIPFSVPCAKLAKYIEGAIECYKQEEPSLVYDDEGRILIDLVEYDGPEQCKSLRVKECKTSDGEVAGYTIVSIQKYR